jgi:hypothetical protein
LLCRYTDILNEQENSFKRTISKNFNQAADQLYALVADRLDMPAVLLQKEDSLVFEDVLLIGWHD